MKTFLKIMVAAIVAMGMVCVLIAYDASDNVCLAGYVATAIAMCGVLGVFDVSAIKRNMKHTSIKDASRYGQAAIFVGTACLFIGEPNECEELADGLQHYAQKCKVGDLTGEETFEVL